jgi:selenocysteine-specific elongation factor
MTVIATAGHVDHGKSSLVLALTGTDPDRFEEEKRRGLTIDLGFAHTTLPSGADLSFIDVPGHVRFLRNMLAGVGGVSGCVFVVAATEGWKPQSEEHLRILGLLGIDRGIVALTKADLVDADLLELARMDVADHVAASFLASAPVVAVSSVTGSGLDELRAELDNMLHSVASGSSGPISSGLGSSDSRPLGPVLDRHRPRLWIDRVFAAKGSGTVVTGTLVDGSLSADQQLVVAPLGGLTRIRSIQRAGRTVESSGPGERVALNLVGLDQQAIGRGDVLVEPGRWRLTDRFDASLAVLDALDHDVSRRGAYLAYIGSGEHPVRMRVLGTETLAPGTVGAVRLFLPRHLPLLPGDRFVIRESGRDETIGGGEVLDIDPVIKASKAAPDRTLGRLVRERGWLSVAQVEELTGEVVEPTIGQWVTTPEAVEAMAASICERVDAAGPLGLDIAALDERERTVVGTLDSVALDNGRIRTVGSIDPLADHPFLAELLRSAFAPVPPDGVDRGELRELVRRGDIVQRDGIMFHRETIRDAARIAGELLAQHPDGFTVAQFRDATGASRKFSLPLIEELDARGITRRRDDRRIAGPRLS